MINDSELFARSSGEAIMYKQWQNISCFHIMYTSVNVIKGLKMYENIFTGQELSKLNDFVDAGQNGELLGETYILFNKQIKAN
ncbi:hypothetical protein SOVF_075150 [Spinacia oleracea]|nr:hypothetical protein SOVF_075150 [Spinacia oleracea]